MIAESLAQYRIIKKLGKGGMGEVYLAQDTKLDRKVAIKVLSEDTLAH
jgi:serine/threonine protein kinase